MTQTSQFKAKLQVLHPLCVAISIFCLCIYYELSVGFLKKSEIEPSGGFCGESLNVLYIYIYIKDNFVYFGII